MHLILNSFDQMGNTIGCKKDVKLVGQIGMVTYNNYSAEFLQSAKSYSCVYTLKYRFQSVTISPNHSLCYSYVDLIS